MNLGHHLSDNQGQVSHLRSLKGEESLSESRLPLESMGLLRTTDQQFVLLAHVFPFPRLG